MCGLESLYAYADAFLCFSFGAADLKMNLGRVAPVTSGIDMHDCKILSLDFCANRNMHSTQMLLLMWHK